MRLITELGLITELCDRFQRFKNFFLLIRRDFSGEPKVTCHTFEVGQSVQNGSLGMAMVIRTNAGDHLYLCLGNSNRDISWANSPNWTSYAYDNPAIHLSKLEIVNVFLCEPAGGTQYIIVDVVRDPSSNVKDIERFYIDPNRQRGHYWNSHDLPIDVEADNYHSCLGRAPWGSVDGLYTAGHAGESGQLAFRPVINWYNQYAPPTPVRLNLPGGAVPSAIASTRNSDQSTDLFVTSGSTLYYFSSSNQADSAMGATLITNDFISDTSKLAAMLHKELITLWGRNGSDQVYYTSCPLSQVSDPSAWSVPIPVLSGIEKMSPYINVANGGNTIFAAGGGKLQRITQAPQSKLWQTHGITLPVPPRAKSISFNSYTTTIQVADEQGLPLKDTLLGLSASNPCAVYINGLYYRLDATPIHIKSNSLGSITIVEATDTLNGTKFTVSTGSGSSTTINPMDKPFKKFAALNTSDKLRAARIDLGNGNTKPLIASDTSDNDVQTIATALGNLSQSYNNLTTPAAPRAFAPAPAPPFSVDDIGHDIVVAAGDIYNWLKSGVEAVIHVIKDAATEVWHFIANIAGKVYRAVLDTVEAVVGAIEWVFNAIKTAIEDIIEFIKFLFEWGDIKRTKEVLHNLLKRYTEGQVSSIQTMKQDFDNMIAGVESTVNQWAHIQDWSGLGSAASKPASGSASNPMKGQTSASQHLSHHFQNNAHNISIVSGAPSPNLLQPLIDDLWTALKGEAHVLEGVLDQLEQLATDFSRLSVEDVLKRLVGILADGVLSSAQVVVDAILKILSNVATTALGILDAKLHIPVISDILNAIGVPDISFLDLFCWISAVAYTVVYKIAEGKAPFPDDANTTFLKTASSLSELQQAFSSPPSSLMMADEMMEDEMIQPAAAPRPEDSGPFQLPQGVQDAIFITGHSVAGFCTLMADFVNTFEAAEETGENPFGIPSAVLGVITGGSVGIANFLVPKAPIKNQAVKYIGTATTGIVILCKVLFSGPLQKKFGASEGIMNKLAANDGRATGAIVNSILIIPALACTGWHFYELSQDSAGNERTDAILEEVSNLTSYISRVAYTAAVNTKNPETKAIEIGIMAVANVAYSGLQTAEAIVN